MVDRKLFLSIWVDNVFWPIIFGGSWDDANGKLTANQQANVDAIAYEASYYKEFGIDPLTKFKSGMGGMNFRHITFPSISPMTLFLVIMGLIGSLQFFTQGYVFADSSNQAIGGPDIPCCSMPFICICIRRHSPS